MDFSYTDSHIEIRKLAAEILNDHSSTERLKKLEAKGPYLDTELWNKVVESGLHSASLPEAIGGMGLDFTASALVAEALGETVSSIPYIACIISTALPLASVKNNSPVDAALTKVIQGQLITTAHIEPGNEDALQPHTQAMQQNQQWLINGVKHCVPYAADASCVMISAMADKQLIVALVDIKQPDIVLTAQQVTTGECQYEIKFNNAIAQVIAQGDAARTLMQKSVAMTLVAYCNMAVGVATKMTRISCDYTSQREQFGVKIATFQAVANRLADCYIDTETLKIITLKATSDVTQGNHSADSIAMAKVVCGDALSRISQAAQHVHGGIGIDRDYHLWRYCVWAKFLELALGSSRVHLAHLADSIEKKYCVNKQLAG